MAGSSYSLLLSEKHESERQSYAYHDQSSVVTCCTLFQGSFQGFPQHAILYPASLLPLVSVVITSCGRSFLSR
jgi:hypothetical protein